MSFTQPTLTVEQQTEIAAYVNALRAKHQAPPLVWDNSIYSVSQQWSYYLSSNNLFQQATGSRTSAHGKYTLYKGTSARAGEFVTVWNGTSTEYYDNSTRDIGNTTDITFQSLIVTGQIQINAIAASSGWTVKMITTYL